MRSIIIAAVLMLALTTPAQAAPVRCTTYEQQTLRQLYTVCDDGTRAVSAYNRTLSRWESTVTTTPRQACTRKERPCDD